jgi:hypothetical protein
MEINLIYLLKYIGNYALLCDKVVDIACLQAQCLDRTLLLGIIGVTNISQSYKLNK